MGRESRQFNPTLEIEGRGLVMVTQFASAVPARELGDRAASLTERQDEILNALDMLISGF